MIFFKAYLKNKKPLNRNMIRDEKLVMNSINMNKTEKEHELVFPEFEDIRVSTKTFIAMTNLM